MTESSLIQFQLKRQIINLTKDVLFLLESNHSEIKKLEKTLIEMGLENYKESHLDYQKDRARVLGKSNDIIRELQSLIESFDIKLKKD